MTCTMHSAGSARRCPRVWCHRCQAASLSLRATTGQWMWHQRARPSPAPAAQFAAWLHGGPVLPVALSLTPAACRATCLATTVKQEGKTTALLALSYSLTQPWQWGRAPRSPLSVKARLFATEWPGCDYGSVPTGDLLDYGEMPKTATIFGSTPRRRGHPRGCSQQAETVSGCLLGTNGSSTAGPTFLSTPCKSNKHLCRASA